MTNSVVQTWRALLAEGASVEEATAIIQLADAVEMAVIDLSSQVWKHEPRGKGGRWVKSGAPTTPRIAPPSKRRAIRRAQLAAQGRLPASAAPSTQSRAKEISQKPATLGHLAVAQEQTARIAQQAAHEEAMHALSQAKEIHENYVKEHAAAETAEEKRKSWLKFFGVVAALLVGAAAGLLLAGLGVPAVAAAFAGISPALAEALYEKKFEL